MTGTLPLTKILSPNATRAHVLSGLENSSLLSMGQLCDDECTAIFYGNHLHVYKNADLILMGNRNKIDGLWDVKIDKNITTNMYQFELKLIVIIRKDKTKLELADYIHACAFSPTLTIFHQAIKNQNFVTYLSQVCNVLF